jgi:hypothetical protein
MDGDKLSSNLKDYIFRCVGNLKKLADTTLESAPVLHKVSDGSPLRKDNCSLLSGATP